MNKYIIYKYNIVYSKKINVGKIRLKRVATYTIHNNFPGVFFYHFLFPNVISTLSSISTDQNNWTVTSIVVYNCTDGQL